MAACLATGCGIVGGCRSHDPEALRRVAERLQRLEARVNILQSEQERGQFAAFSPGDSRSQYMRSNVGPMAVSLGALVRAGNDGQLRLRLGNLTSADIGDCTVSLSWGKAAVAVEPTTSAQATAAPQGGRRRTVTVGGPLRAGRWTNSNVTLPNTRPADITYVRLDQLECQSATLE
jgi:hypothetical protein